jgi:biopolymer transport protein ExbD
VGLRNLYLDDSRPLPDYYIDSEWVVVRDPFKAVQLLKFEKFNIVSLDHDLTCFTEGKEVTGYAVLKELVEYYKERPKYKPNAIIIHSASTADYEKMQNVIKENWP